MLGQITPMQATKKDITSTYGAVENRPTLSFC